jgi:hypothetical protein
MEVILETAGRLDLLPELQAPPYAYQPLALARELRKNIGLDGPQLPLALSSIFETLDVASKETELLKRAHTADADVEMTVRVIHALARILLGIPLPDQLRAKGPETSWRLTDSLRDQMLERIDDRAKRHGIHGSAWDELCNKCNNTREEQEMEDEEEMDNDEELDDPRVEDETENDAETNEEAAEDAENLEALVNEWTKANTETGESDTEAGEQSDEEDD